MPRRLDLSRRLQVVLAYDTAALVRLRRWEWPWVTHAMVGVTQLGNPAGWLLTELGVLLSRRDRRRRALLLTLGTGIGGLFSQLLKRTLRRPRPSTVIRGFSALARNPDAFSFPSGHTTVAVGAAMALSGEGLALTPIAWAFAFTTGVARVYLGAHYPLDVLAGGLLGVAAGALARLIVADSLIEEPLGTRPARAALPQRTAR